MHWAESVGRYNVYPYTVHRGVSKPFSTFASISGLRSIQRFRHVDFCKDKHPGMGSKHRERMMTLERYWVTNGLTGVSTLQESSMIAIYMVSNYKFVDTKLFQPNLLGGTGVSWFLFKDPQTLSNCLKLKLPHHGSSSLSLRPCSMLSLSTRRQEYSFTMPESALTNIFKARGHRFGQKFVQQDMV